ncbi:histidine phosphatase family protein [Lactobacillus rodentium]|uniref:Phosphoglycerate mutase n=1 Tax=Lactobacillus rodentium TaxID=947835 RepID=A0A2Z6TCX3_9LACO|nr:histidine phosphatase family protein [Lactobacillus rodentium]MCR1894386.1 histidine phosphatase family protein [Lactobacillus rodentium]GBG04685.1 phosphoglycerate mutase [Lactobacillus rodentium]
MKLYFVRHGKTQWNLEGRYQGGSGNSPLLPSSYEDIKKLAHYLNKKGVKFKAFYASPLERAVTTAKTLKKDMGIDVPVIEDKRLKEFNLGDLEGMKFVDAEAQYPDQIHAFRYEPAYYDPSAFKGETFEHMIARGKDLINDLVKKYPDKDDNILLVSHGAALCALTRTLEGYKIADIRKRGGLTNTSLTVLETNDGGKNFQEKLWNETSYLDRKITSRDTI